MILYFIKSKTKKWIKTSLCDLLIHAWKGYICIFQVPELKLNKSDSTLHP